LARKILLADDSVTAQNMGRKILADAGYDVVTVNNGSAALKRINELRPDLIVLDVYMPGYSGLEVCQRIKDADDTAHIPVLLTVGKLEPFKPEEARRVRADAHIVKPFEASELLTAITKLEDRMVPQADGSRFSASAAGVERFNGESGGRKSANKGETDTGWKSRIRFPSKKKKEEPEPEPEDVAAAAGATFRDFRKGKGNTGGSIFGLNGPSAGQEPSHVPDIPRDITPEELDALSAVAAKLDAPAPATHEAAPKAENKASEEPIPPAPNRETFAVVSGAEEKVEAAAVVEPASSAVEAADDAQSSAVLSSEGEVAVQPLPSAAEAQAATNQEVKTDRQEAEGMEGGHSQIAAEGPAAENQTLPAEGSSAESAAASLNASPNVSTNASPNEEPGLGSIEGDPSKESFEVKPADAIADAPPVTANEDLEAVEGPAPSDAELTEALRLLTPSTANVTTAPSNGNAAAHSQLLAEEVACNNSGPRWIAESVGLSAEEATNSLEAEMFRTFATSAPANGSAPATIAGGELDPERVTGVSAIAAAVENRLAAAGMAVDSKYDSKSWSSHSNQANQAPEHASDHLGQQSMENAVAEAAAALEASAELLAAASAATPVVDLIGAEVERKIAGELVARELVESEKKNSEANAAEQAPVEEFASATFADAMGKNEIEAATETSTEVGGQDSMGKAGKTKSGKSDLQQTQAAAVEQTKPAAETASKAMAAAADSSVSADAKTIANIVDSVMADLRPRIVEEIARKLAGK
jgi:CheY-like chemotaxis protein